MSGPAHGMRGQEPARRLCGKAASLSQLLRPVDCVDVDAEWILFQAVGVAWLLHGDGEDRGPAFGRSELAVFVGALGPGDAKTVGRGADDAGDLDGDLALADLGERIVG